VYDWSVVRAYFICVLRMYIMCSRRFIHKLYIFIAPSPPFCKRFDPLARPPYLRPAHKPSLTPRVTRHTTVIPHPYTATPPVSHSLYIVYTTPPSVPGRARRVIYAPPSSPPPSPSRRLVDYLTPPPAQPRLYILWYIGTRTRP